MEELRGILSMIIISVPMIGAIFFIMTIVWFVTHNPKVVFAAFVITGLQIVFMKLGAEKELAGVLVGFVFLVLALLKIVYDF